MKLSYKVSLGGVMTALCLALMFLTAIFPVLSMAVPIYAGAILVIVAVEINSVWAFFTYAASALLCIFVTPDKEAAILFIMFFGYYPILRRVLDQKVNKKLIRLIIKLLIFNAAITVSVYLITEIFGVYNLIDEFGFLGDNFILILYGIANALFLFYDMTLKLLEDSYVGWFRKVYLRKK